MFSDFMFIKKMLSFLVLLLLCIAFFACSSVAGVSETSSEQEVNSITELAVAQLEGGDILGYRENGTFSFRGIRYATAERYEIAELHSSWDGTMNALDFKEVCASGSTSRNMFEFMTRSSHTPIQSEDCFFLNVWTQSLNKEAKKPVIVFMHGGGYTDGSSSGLAYYEGKNLSQYGDIVFVSLNHRLNALGFLDLSAYGEEYKDTPNLGINDLIVGLKWVQENIDSFGGDPSNVTIIGQSGGGGKVIQLMGVPSAQGLFNRVWAMSSFVDQPMPKDAALAQTEKTLEILGIDSSNIDVIKSVPYSELIAAANEAHCSWGPVIDEVFYPEPTFNLADNTVAPLAKDIPIVITSTFSEFSANFPGISVFYDKNGYVNSHLPSLTDDVVMKNLEERFGKNAQKVADAFTSAYPGHQLAEVLFINGQRMKWMSMAQAFAKGSNASVYQGLFAYRLPVFGGVTSFHTGGDLPFIFHNTSTIKYMVNGDDKNAEFVEQFSSQALINYAYTGDPGVGDVTWPVFTEETGDTMIIDSVCESRPYHDVELFNLLSSGN